MSNDNLPVPPPDMVGAGVTPPPTPPGDLLSALRSQGSMPSGALQMLASPPPGPLMTGLNALGAGVFAGRGQANPIADQQMAQQREQRLQMQAAFQQQDMMARQQERQQLMKERRTKSLFDISKVFLDSNDQTTREAGAKYAGEALQNAGLNPSKGALAGLTKRAVTKEQMAAAGRYLDMPTPMDPKTITELTGVPPEVQQELAANKTSDSFSQMVYGKTLAQRKQEQTQADISDINLWKAKHPMDAKVESEASIMAQEKFSRTLDQLSDTDRAALSRAAQTRMDARERAKEQRKLSDEITLIQKRNELEKIGKKPENQPVFTMAQHNVTLIDKQGNQYNGDPMALTGDVMKQGYEMVKLTTAKEIQGGKYSFKIFGNMRAQAAKMAQNGKLLAAGQAYEKVARSSPDYAAAQQGDPGAIERVSAYVKYNIGNATKDPDILVWAGMESEMVIALRAMGEKGLRAIQAFSGAMNVMKTGQYDAIDQYIRNLEVSSSSQFDQKYQGVFGTRYYAINKQTKKPVEVELAPGEALDLKKYEIRPEFAMPPR